MVHPTFLGATLSQEDENGNLRLISCGSRKLVPAQKNYPAHENECIALVDTLQRWRHYLHGAHQVIVQQINQQNQIPWGYDYYMCFSKSSLALTLYLKGTQQATFHGEGDMIIIVCEVIKVSATVRSQERLSLYYQLLKVNVG